MHTIKLTDEQRKFIMNNAGIIPQAEIARKLNVSPACVNMIILGKRHVVDNDTGYFNIDSFKKHYTY